MTGTKLTATCDTCVAQICAVKPSCCSNQWGAQCVNDIATVCGQPSCPSTCTHNECTTGTALTASCDPCVSAVCANDSYCCDKLFGEWDIFCIDDVAMYCTTTCP